MVEAPAREMAKKRATSGPAPEPASKTVRISMDAYKAARKVVKLIEGDLGDYISALVLKHADKDYWAEFRKLAEKEKQVGRD